MSKLVIGGIAMAALFTVSVASAQTPTVPNSQSKHSRGSFFTSNQNRSDIPAHVEKMFGALDLDHDGFVTRAEIAAGQAQFDARMAKSAPKRAARMFDRMDSDRDGKISLAEVEATRAARHSMHVTPTKPRHSLPSLFRLADANKDGAVTRSEFDAAVDANRIKLRHAHMRGNQIVQLFDTADTNRDGRLSLQEAQAAADQRFDAADANHDQVLTPVERRQASKTERAKRRAAG